MPAVARAARRVEPGVELDGKAVSLPVGEAARERNDVLVPELLKRLRRERRAVAGGAIDNDTAGLIRDGALDARLQIAARDVQRAGDVPLVPLVLLADVEDDGLGGVDQLARLRGVDLGDLAAHLLEQFPVRRHRFPKYSRGL